jgi:hypothetical protein
MPVLLSDLSDTTPPLSGDALTMILGQALDELADVLLYSGLSFSLCAVSAALAAVMLMQAGGHPLAELRNRLGGRAGAVGKRYCGDQ